MIAAVWALGLLTFLLAAALVLQGGLLHEAHLDLRHERGERAAAEKQLGTYAAAFADQVERDLHDGGEVS